MQKIMNTNIRLANNYSASRPVSTHWREATCQEVDCLHYLQGWETKIDISTELGKAQYNYIIHKSGKRGKGKQDGNMITFIFFPEQKCFREHKLPLDREPILTIQKGHDRRIARAGEWHDDMNESIHKHQQDVGK